MTALWTRNDDLELTQLVHAPIREVDINWITISENFTDEEKTAQECFKRWMFLGSYKDRPLNVRNFHEEDLTLLKSVHRRNKNFDEVAQDMDYLRGRCLNIYRRSLISVAAADIYMASQASEDKKSQKEIGDIAGVDDVTIQQSYKLMYPRAAELFPEDFKFFTPIENLPQL